MINLFVAILQGQPLTGPKIIAKMNAAVRAASPLTGTLETVGPAGQYVTLTFKAMYPRMYSDTMIFRDFITETHLNKKGYFIYGHQTHSYTRLPDAQAATQGGPYGLDAIFGGKFPYAVADTVTSVKFHNRGAYAVAITTSPSNDIHIAKGDTLYVDSKTFLPLGFDESDPSAGGTDHSVYKNMVIHAKLKAKDFDWTPPKGVKLVNRPAKK